MVCHKSHKNGLNWFGTIQGSFLFALMFVKIGTPWRNSQKLMKCTLYISESNINKRLNLQNKTKRTSEISTLCIRHTERWEPVYVVALNHTGSVCNLGEWHSRCLRLKAKVHSYSVPHLLFEQVADQWNLRHARWETYPGNILVMEEA